MEKAEVIKFFDCCAENWDSEMIRDDRIIDEILDGGGVCAGKRVLDVACGTGVLVPDYLKRKVKSVCGIDISPEMIKIARKKFNRENVEFICDDVETAHFDEKFDCAVVYNAFPHFPDPENLIRVLAECLCGGGVLTVAHGMSRKKIDSHHSGSASRVSVGLMSENELADIFSKYFDVDTVISNDDMYQVSGRKR